MGKPTYDDMCMLLAEIISLFEGREEDVVQYSENFRLNFCHITKCIAASLLSSGGGVQREITITFSDNAFVKYEFGNLSVCFDINDSAPRNLENNIAFVHSGLECLQAHIKGAA
jgi:hypothetical protein